MNKLVTFRHLAVAGILSLLAASCSDVTDDGTTLPPGACPMTFTASVDGLTATRATTDADGKTSWQAEDPVAISMDGDANHKEYKISNTTDGAMVPDGDGNTLYWSKRQETLAAWHPVSCTIGNNTGNSEVDITNQSSGFGTLENILHAPAQKYTYSSSNPVAFVFRHALAKVKVTLKKGDGIEDSDLSSATVTFTGYTAGSLGYSGMTGSGDGSNGDITPKTETASGSATTYTALVIPQQMQGKKFIKVTIGAGGAARDYFYTPTGSTDANLEAGKQYTYTITVKKTGLEVTVTGNGTAWTDTSINTTPDASFTYHITAPTSGVTIAAVPGSGGTLTDNGNGSYTLSDGNAVSITNDYGARIDIKGLYDVAGDGTTYTLKSDLLVEYSLDAAQVGDFYCKTADGTTGYLIPGDASLTEAQQAACIGIVYSTDVSRIGAAATKFLSDKGITPHGLVMALTDASEGCRWGAYEKDENSSGNDGTPFKANTNQLQKQYKNVDGYGETHWIIDTYKSNGTALKDTYTAFYHASLYGTAESSTGKYAVPSNTTGWFIPGMGQWWDILSNLGKIDLTSYQGDTGSSTSIPGAAQTAVANMNTYLQKISGATQFSTGTYFWSSSEYRGDSACGVYFDSSGYLYLNSNGKNYSGRRVRCSFAF